MARKSFAAAPKKSPPTPKQIEAFVKSGAGTDQPEDEPLQRLSVNLPESLHTRFKAACAQARTKMAAEIIAFVEKRTQELEQKSS